MPLPRLFYYKSVLGGLLLVSEPVDGTRGNWREVPRGCTLVARQGRDVELSGTADVARAACSSATLTLQS